MLRFLSMIGPPVVSVMAVSWPKVIAPSAQMSAMAWRSDPAPLSFAFVTVMALEQAIVAVAVAVLVAANVAVGVMVAVDVAVLVAVAVTVAVAVAVLVAVAVTVAVDVAVLVAVAVTVAVAVAVAVLEESANSNAPMSQCKPCGRAMPR